MFWLILMCAGAINNANSQTVPFQLNPTWNEPDQAVSKRFNYFDLELLREVATDENVFVSPASVKATLGMILEGADGVCADEIKKTLRLPEKQNEARAQLRPLLYDLSDKSANSVLESANGMFVNSKLKVIDNYKMRIEEFYKGFVKSINFANNAKAAETINTWVSNSTRGLIPNLVTPDVLGAELSIFVTNALYFKGRWREAFDPKVTAIKCFQLPSSKCQNVYMMQNTAEINYSSIEEIDAHALELPYSDDKYAMMVLLPRMKNNVAALMRDLQHTSFGSIVDKLEMTEVFYEIPRFTIDFSIDLTQTLKQLGIRQLFEERANLSGIVEQDKIYVDTVLQKTKIDVNEIGTTAAAASAAVVVPLMGSAKPRIIANHPFAFFIYRKDNRNILFEGIVNRPTEAPTIKGRANVIPTMY